MSRPTKSKTIAKSKTLDKKHGGLEFSAVKASGDADHIKNKGEKRKMDFPEESRGLECGPSASTAMPMKSLEIGYVHELSIPMRNKRNTMDYSTFKLQTSPTKYKEGLLYSPPKRQLLKSSEETRTPIKLERLTHTKDGEKIIINGATKISTPDQSEYEFQYTKLTPNDETFINIQNILENCLEYDRVNVKGKLVQITERRKVNDNLQVVSGVLVDGNASIFVDIWDPHIASIQDGQAYSFISATVRVWNGKKKISLGRQSKLYPLHDSSLNSIEESLVTMPEENVIVSTSIEQVVSISSVNVYLACAHCKRKIVQVDPGPICHCDKCGHTMKSSKCGKSVLAIFVVENGEGESTTTITAFQEVLESIISREDIYTKRVIEETLLTSTGVEIQYNKETFVVTKFVKS